MSRTEVVSQTDRHDTQNTLVLISWNESILLREHHSKLKLELKSKLKYFVKLELAFSFH